MTTIPAQQTKSISEEWFNQKIEEQNRTLNAIKWRELEQGKIYTILDVKVFNTRFGEACVLHLDGDINVYSPSSLTKRLKEDIKSEVPFPRYVRSTGLKQSTQNAAHTYHSFDLV